MAFILDRCSEPERHMAMSKMHRFKREYDARIDRIIEDRKMMLAFK